MTKAIDLGKYSSYNFEKSDVKFSHLQYADDTLIITEKRWSNIKSNIIVVRVDIGIESKFPKNLPCGDQCSPILDGRGCQNYELWY